MAIANLNAKFVDINLITEDWSPKDGSSLRRHITDINDTGGGTGIDANGYSGLIYALSVKKLYGVVKFVGKFEQPKQASGVR